MAGSVFVDTDVLFYAYDPRDVLKQGRALIIIRALAQLDRGVVSTQVLGEFFAATTTGRRRFLDAEAARSYAQNIADAFRVLDVTKQTVFEAMRGARFYQLRYWDAHLWATALLNRVPVFLTEDFQRGRILEGVQFLDPFDDGFDLNALLALR
jgi:predicted nucleic acid-binding protein